MTVMSAFLGRFWHPNFFRSLRFRIAGWNAFVVFATATVLLIGVRQGVKAALVVEIDEQLKEDLNELALTIQTLDKLDLPLLEQQLERKASGHEDLGWFVRLIGEERNLIWESRKPQQAGSQRPTWESEMTGAPDESHRVKSRKLDPPVAQINEIQVGCSLVLTSDELARIDSNAINAFLVLCAAAPLIGFWLASRAIRPLAEITDTARRIDANQLAERLPQRGTGDELDRLSSTLNGLLDRVAQQQRARRDFLANSAHELRSPLAAIRSSVEVALLAPRSGEEYEQLLQELIDESTSLEQLVNQLLLLAETDAERLSVQAAPVRFDELVRKAVNMFEAVADTRSIRLTSVPFPEVVVAGNVQHLRQVVNNLLDNALKFTPDGGTVRVSITQDLSQAQMTLTVQDSGCGIPASDLPHIFDRFFRGERFRARHGPIGGTGLGLSICEGIVSGHQGTIHAESVMGQGTSLIVTFPTLPAQPSSDARPAP